MAFSSIELTFANFESGNPLSPPETVDFDVSGVAKNEVAALIRTGPGQFQVSDSLGSAINYRAAWLADYAGTMYTVTRVGTVVTITATFDGAVFENFSNNNGRVTAVIDNVAFDPPFNLTAAVLSAADTNPCTTIKVTLSQADGLAPFEWVSPLPANPGLIGTLPRSGSNVLITVEDANTDQDSISVFVPGELTVAAIDEVVIAGDDSGLYATVSVLMTTIQGLTYEYSLNGADFQTSNTFTGILPGPHTVYVRDQYGCTITQAINVTVQSVRPPAYRNVPLSNSFGWYEEQAAPDGATVHYNARNVRPNHWQTGLLNNPAYGQPWVVGDVVQTQFRSNYDTLVAELIDNSDGSVADTMTIVKKSDNLGKRQIMDVKLYDRGGGQTGLYFTSGNIYDSVGAVIDTYDLDGELPEWVRIGQKITITGTAADGLFEIKQIIFDSTLLVNAAIIDRVYTDLLEPATGKVDAFYNRLNYEVYEFETSLAVVEGCYKVRLSMTDSQAEYQDSIWNTSELNVSPDTTDLIHLEYSDHPDDGIDYTTGIVHQQRVRGWFYPEEYAATLLLHRDSRRKINVLDGRTEKMFLVNVHDVPMWVYEKLSLAIAKRNKKLNGVEVTFEEAWEKEGFTQYSRVNLIGKAIVENYEQYATNIFEILSE